MRSHAQQSSLFWAVADVGSVELYKLGRHVRCKEARAVRIA